MNFGGFSDLKQFLNNTSLEPKGCFVDTSILFAATYPLDSHNEDAEIVFKYLSQFKLSAFTKAASRVWWRLASGLNRQDFSVHRIMMPTRQALTV